MQNVTFVLKTENSFQFSIPFPKLLNSQNAHLVCSRVTAEKSFKGKQTKLFERLISWNLQDIIIFLLILIFDNYILMSCSIQPFSGWRSILLRRQLRDKRFKTSIVDYTTNNIPGT